MKDIMFILMVLSVSVFIPFMVVTGLFYLALQLIFLILNMIQ
jgi:hypothetical protein